MAIVNVWVGDRLIHGQVAAVWSLVTKANRVMVVGNLIVRDVIDGETLKMTCPQRCKLSIFTVEKATENLKTGKYGKERVFIVAKNLKTIRGLLDHGFQVEAVSVGSMGRKQNTKMLKKTIDVSQEDIEDSLYLADHGMKVTAQVAPTDEALDFVELIKKAEA